MSHRRSALHVSLALAGTLAALALPQSARGASGGDGIYTWKDTAEGIVYEDFVPSPLTIFNPPDNGAPRLVTMGLAGGFDFYGTNYTQWWVSDNGWISFVDPTGDSHPVPSAIPDAAGPSAMLAGLWVDLDGSNPSLHLNYYGPVPSIGGWLASWRSTNKVSGTDVNLTIVLFPDGRIRYQYQTLGSPGTATIGIENAGATRGIEIAAGGMLHPDIVLVANYAIEFLPPPVFAGECAVIPASTCTTINDRLPGTLPENVTGYSCAMTAMAARERAYKVTIAAPTRLDVALTGAGSQVAMVLDGCNERACIAGPGTNLSVPVGPGEYIVVVDAAAVAQEGPFTLTIGCTGLGRPLACGASAAGTTAGGSTFFDRYSCTTTPVVDGSEALFLVDVAAATNLAATLTSGAAGLDVFVLSVDSGVIDGTDCVGWGDAAGFAWNAQPGQYLVVVDGPAGPGAAFDLSVTCQVLADCSGPVGTISMGNTVRTMNIAGDTTGAANRVTRYSCAETADEAGGEEVWTLTLTSPGQVGVYNLLGSQSYYLLSECNEGTCLGTGWCGMNLAAGTYRLVVDGAASGPYEAMLIFDEQYDRFTSCEDAVAPTLDTDTTNTFWNLSDAAFCITSPNSHNYPDGCVFAMYITPRCGTSVHIPLYDTEGGHLRVYDVFRGEYVFLTAQSGTGWFQQGTEIQWQDMDCIEGSDPNWNETITDVFFSRPEGLCGIFRIEFINHSGNVWELYSNCVGDRSPLFEIHDSLCTAVSRFAPLPNVGLVSATADYNCPDITITYTIENDGCAPVFDFPVELMDGMTVVDTDLVDRLLPGEERTIVFTTSFMTTPTNGVTLNADFGRNVTECEEAAPGSTCGSTMSVDQLTLLDCIATCQVQAQATATPARACTGDTVTIDARATLSSLCSGPLEYQLRGPAGTIPWQASPIFAGLTPTADANYTLEARCSTDPTCDDQVTVLVRIERPPTFDRASVAAVDESPCGEGIVVSWDGAIFHGSLGSGSYNIYHSTTSCADALTRAPIAVETSNTWTHSMPGPGSHYYVVEAEDSEPNTTCVPAGPRTGAVTRVEANGGTCVAVLDVLTSDPSLLPHVGDRLRLGGTNPDFTQRYAETFVDLTWGTDVPLDVAAGEHFHVMRSATARDWRDWDQSVPMPMGPPRSADWQYLTTDIPRLTVPVFTDFLADHPNTLERGVWFYLVFVADECEGENWEFDGGDQ